MKKNEDIRIKARKAGVFMYELAKELGYSVSKLCVILREDLSPREREKIFSAIDALEKRKDSET